MKMSIGNGAVVDETHNFARRFIHSSYWSWIRPLEGEDGLRVDRDLPICPSGGPKERITPCFCSLLDQ